MSEEKKAMNAEELENAAGGYGYQNGFYMTVGDCNGTYLALRSGTSYSPYNESAQLYPGYIPTARLFREQESTELPAITDMCASTACGAMQTPAS